MIDLVYTIYSSRYHGMPTLSTMHYHHPANDMHLLLSMGYAILDNQNLHIRLNIPKELRKNHNIQNVFQSSLRK